MASCRDQASRQDLSWERIAGDWNRSIQGTGGWCGSMSAVLEAIAAAINASAALQREIEARNLETPLDFMRAWTSSKQWKLLEQPQEDRLILRRPPGCRRYPATKQP